LRIETAAIIIGIIQYELGDLCLYTLVYPLRENKKGVLEPNTRRFFRGAWRWTEIASPEVATVQSVPKHHSYHCDKSRLLEPTHRTLPIQYGSNVLKGS
jgi:hypothetical protein